MTLETFFEEFDQFADAPDAVAKMRELILRLAMQGKLVSQNPRDEPADSLAVELKEEAGENNGRRAAPLPPIAPDEIPFELPAGWVWVRLGNIGETNIGLTYSPQDVSEVGTPVLRSSNVQNGKLDFDDLVRVACEPKQSVMVRDGDLLICARNGSRALVGKVALIENMTEPAAFGAFMAIFRSRVNRFLYHFICSPLFRRMIDEVNTTTINQITQNNLRSTLAPIPPLAEQKRIVAKVDELMALCDRLALQQQERETRHAALARASLARFADAPTPANLPFLFHPSYAIPLADLRKSILTLAVQGKLVPQDPNDEPAEEIVSRVEAERPEETEAPVDEAELPWSLPSCWQWVRLGALGNIKHGYAFSSESFTSEPTRYVLTTPGNFYESGGFRDRGANTKYFSGEAPPAFVFKARDLIIPMTEQAAGLLGSPAFIPDDGKTYLHNQRLGKMEFYSDEVSPEFVFCFFNSEFFRGELARTCTGMKVRHTSPKRILRVPFPLPPLAEQRRIVAKVEQLMALVDALETQLAASRATAANLLAALVAELTTA